MATTNEIYYEDKLWAGFMDITDELFYDDKWWRVLCR